MKKIRLCIGEKSFKKHKELITGIIYFEINNYSFPEKKWNDFVIVVMNNWIKSLKDIRLGITEDAELLFFDGPFFLKIKMINKEDCIIEFFEGHKSENVLFTEEIKFKNLVNEVFHIANLCKAICENHNWKTEELNKLDLLLQK